MLVFAGGRGVFFFVRVRRIFVISFCSRDIVLVSFVSLLFRFGGEYWRGGFLGDEFVLYLYF